jgi:peptide deformylase
VRRSRRDVYCHRPHECASNDCSETPHSPLTTHHSNMIYPIRSFGDPVLRMPAALVRQIDAGVRRLVEDMIETMYHAPGVGLAAPQIGVPRAVLVFDVQDDKGAQVLINPELIETSGEYEYDEGCLSIPGYFWPLVRPGFARAKGLDLEGNEVEYAGDELLGRVLQHEIDHLHGILVIERLDNKTRKQALKELRNAALGLAEI